MSKLAQGVAMHPKKIRTCLLAAYILIGLHGTASAFSNEPQGFRGITWGTEFSAVKAEMVLKENDGDDKWYARSGDKMSIGDAQLSDIAYHFYKGRLADVFIKVKPISKLQIIQTLKTQFGEGERPNEFMDRYFWEGTTTEITLDCKPISDECMTYISSVKIGDERAADQAKAAAGAKKDF